MSTPNKKFVKSVIILGCNWLTVSKIKKNSGKVWFRWCVMVGREDAKKEVILVYSLVICYLFIYLLTILGLPYNTMVLPWQYHYVLWILIQFAKRS